MRKLTQADIEAVMECLGYFGDTPGSYVTSGKVTGPKGMVFGALDPDEYITAYELLVFLVDFVELLEEDVRECIGSI